MSIRTSILRIALSLGALTLGEELTQATTTVGSSQPPGTLVTVGTWDTGNCYPFMCNDSGTNIGQSIDYQQVFAASSISNSSVSISSIDWYFDATAGGNPILLGGSYEFEWGYAALGSVDNLSTNLASNYTSGPNVLGTIGVLAGGINYGSTLTLSGFAPFTYDPTLGDLLLEIIVTNQDIVPNGSGNGYMEYDDTGTVTDRAYCVTNVGCFTPGSLGGGLVTSFETNPIPEPGTLALLGSGFIALGMICMRRSKA